MLSRPGLVTVRALVPAVLPDVALTIVLPAATPVARPPLLIVASAGLLLDH